MLQSIKRWWYMRGVLKNTCKARDIQLRMRMVPSSEAYLRHDILMGTFLINKNILTNEPYNIRHTLMGLHEIGHDVVYGMIEKLEIQLSVLDTEFYAWQWALMHYPFELQNTDLEYVTHCLSTYIDCTDPRLMYSCNELGTKATVYPEKHNVKEVCNYLSKQQLIGV